MKIVLSIAGSDSGGGAGIQADIKTMTMNGVFATTAITALTAQNTLGVRSVSTVEPSFLEEQLIAIFEDLRPDAVKIGMLASSDLIRVIAKQLKLYQAEHIVLDPVMVSTSGSRLIEEEAISSMCEYLIPLAELLTPNIPEAEILAGMSITNRAEMLSAANLIYEKYQVQSLCKGGHNVNEASDLLFYGNGHRWFEGRRINNSNTHGTGCTLSSAIAANLAKGYELVSAIEKAKQYISEALEANLNLGQGSGPLNHLFNLQGRYAT